MPIEATEKKQPTGKKRRRPMSDEQKIRLGLGWLRSFQRKLAAAKKRKLLPDDKIKQLEDELIRGTELWLAILRHAEASGLLSKEKVAEFRGRFIMPN